MGAVKELVWKNSEEWAEQTNEYYGLDVQPEEVMEVCMNDQWFMDELMDETFSDTLPREAMADAICKNRIGMNAPCYGDSQEYKDEFHHKMNQWVLNQREEV